MRAGTVGFDTQPIVALLGGALLSAVNMLWPPSPGRLRMTISAVPRWLCRQLPKSRAILSKPDPWGEPINRVIGGEAPARPAAAIRDSPPSVASRRVINCVRPSGSWEGL